MATKKRKVKKKAPTPSPEAMRAAESLLQLPAEFYEVERLVRHNGEQLLLLDQRLNDLIRALQSTEPAEHDWMDVAQTGPYDPKDQWQWCKNCGVLRLVNLHTDPDTAEYFLMGHPGLYKTNPIGRRGDIPPCRKRR